MKIHFLGTNQLKLDDSTSGLMHMRSSPTFKNGWETDHGKAFLQPFCLWVHGSRRLATLLNEADAGMYILFRAVVSRSATIKLRNFVRDPERSSILVVARKRCVFLIVAKRQLGMSLGFALAKFPASADRLAACRRR